MLPPRVNDIACTGKRYTYTETADEIEEKDAKAEGSNDEGKAGTSTVKMLLFSLGARHSMYFTEACLSWYGVDTSRIHALPRERGVERFDAPCTFSGKVVVSQTHVKFLQATDDVLW